MSELISNIKNKEIAEIQLDIRALLESAEKCDNKLKTAVVLLTLVEEASAKLKAIDTTAFLNELQDYAKNMIDNSEKVIDIYNQHISLNDGVATELRADTILKLAEQQQAIKKNLADYDAMLKDIISIRQKLPLEKQMQ